MSEYGVNEINWSEGEVDIMLTCRLTTLADVNQVIDMLVRAKTRAFGSGAKRHAEEMTGGDVHGRQGVCENSRAE